MDLSYLAWRLIREIQVSTTGIKIKPPFKEEYKKIEGNYAKSIEMGLEDDSVHLYVHPSSSESGHLNGFMILVSQYKQSKMGKEKALTPILTSVRNNMGIMTGHFIDYKGRGIVRGTKDIFNYRLRIDKDEWKIRRVMPWHPFIFSPKPNTF